MSFLLPKNVFSETVNGLIKICHNNREFQNDDIRINQNANNVREFYHGYQHVIRWDYSEERWDAFIKDRASKWCKGNCKGAFACHIHRVTLEGNEWIMDEISGTDEIFWAFELESDAILFKLRW